MAKVISQLPSGGSVQKHNNLLGLNEGDYIHLTQFEKAKLDGIQSGAEVNVNADWNAISGDAQLLNKPSTFPPSAHTHTKSQITDFAHTHPISDVTGLPMALDDLQLNKEDKSNKNIANGYAGLDSSGKIIPIQLPALAITDTFVVASQAEQLALVAEIGDVAIRTDLNKSFILRVTGASTLANWQELLSPTSVDQIIIDGSTNAVSGNAVFDELALKSNIGHTHVASQITDLSKASVGLGNVDNTSDLSKPLSTATINALATKAPISAVHNPVTLGTANGLSLSTQQLSLGLASSGVTGALSGTDWNTFNNKQNTLTNPITGSLTTGYIPMASGTNSLSNSILKNSSGRLFNGTDDGVNTFQFTGSTRILSGNFNIDPDLALVWGATGATNFAQSYYNATSKKLIFTKSNGVNTLEIEDFSGNVNVPFNLSAATYTGGATLTGTPTAPTAPAGTNTTQIATTAFVQANARPYKVYTAIIQQSGTNAPVATVLENTFGGTLVWGRTSAGVYTGTLTGAFAFNKTVCFATSASGNATNKKGIGITNANFVTLRATNSVDVESDGVVGGLSIEIRVYL